MLFHPARNDVIVKRSRVPGIYVLRTWAGPDQIQMHGREAAIAHALAFAEFAHGCAWISVKGTVPVLLGDFRDEAPVAVRATERGLRSVAT